MVKVTPSWMDGDQPLSEEALEAIKKAEMQKKCKEKTQRIVIDPLKVYPDWEDQDINGCPINMNQ